MEILTVLSFISVFYPLQNSILYGIHTLGTYTTPLLHNLLSSQETCRIHLVFNELSSENLEHSHNIAVTLSKLPTNTKPSKKNLLEIFRNRGWLCELVFFYVKGSKQKITHWLWLYEREYLNFQGADERYNIEYEHLHILLLKKKRILSLFLSLRILESLVRLWVGITLLFYMYQRTPRIV